MCNSACFNGRYRCIRQLGKGGTSSVYLCVDNHIGKKWAVKLIAPDKANAGVNKNLFISEIATLKSLDYYMFPRITDAFFCDGKNGEIGIVTDYIEGETLESRLKRDGPLTEKWALYYFEELLKALLYLHTRSPGILYLDMKPANIMVTPESELKLIDFGIAGTMLTKSRCYGSPGYAPPEQYKPDSILDEKADVFALGMTLYAMITGETPLKDLSLQRQIIKNDARISKGIKNIILKCTNEKVRDRPTPGKVLSMLNLSKSIDKGVMPVFVTGAIVCTAFCIMVYAGVNAYRHTRQKMYMEQMMNSAAEYMIDGEYTHQGIRIICGYIDGDFLNNDIKAKYAYEVARYYFDVMKEYSTAKHYFELTDSYVYPEAVSYIERCEKMKHFSIEEEVK